MDMINASQSDLLEATRLTSAGRLTEATAALQRMLGGQWMPSMPSPGSPPPVIDGQVIHTSDVNPAPQIGPVSRAGIGRLPLGVAEHAGQPFMPDALRGFLDQISRDGFQLPGGERAPAHPRPAPASIPEGAEFLAATFSNHAGSRPYKLYVPSGYRAGDPVPLVVMLHGCTQSPDDFAAGTRMNEAAEERTFIVAYPGQTSSAHRQKCWNWFSEGDQRRGQGEPSLIAGITREIMRDYAIDPRRVYVAGLSAGGAAAAIMADAYPDLFAAVGVHSGLACGAARDLPSALAAMQRGSSGATRARPGTPGFRTIPAIVFHGGRDTTVSPRNGDAVVAQLGATSLSTRTENGHRGYDYTCEKHNDANGQTVIERWTVHGAGHAWFGGSPAGSYTDPRGPDATREMIRFFLEHPHAAPTSVGTS